MGALVVVALGAACADDPAEGPTDRSASEAPVRSTTTTAPGRPTMERVAAEPGVLAAQGDQRMVAAAADATAEVAVAVGTDRGRPAVWRGASAGAWVRVPEPAEMPDGTRLLHVAATATGRFMVVGEVEGAAAAWTSTDGSLWSRADVEDGPPITFVADTSVGPIAFSGEPGSASWKSWDGQAWFRSDTSPEANGSPAPERVVGVADTRSGVLAVVDGGADGPELWSSSDGFSWSPDARRTDELMGASGQVSVSAVTARSGGVLELAGSVADGMGVDAAVWRAERAAPFELVPPDQNVFGGDGAQAVTAMVVASDDRSVAVGTDTPEGGDHADVSVWHSSADGTWTRAEPGPLRMPGDQRVVDVVVLGGEVVAVGHERIEGEDDAAVWRVGTVDVEVAEVPDGPALTWTRLDAEALGAPGEQRLSALAATPDGFVAVGGARSPLDDAGEGGPSSEVGPVPVGASDGAVWRSPDARRWERVGDDDLGGEGDQELHDVALGLDGLVAVGRDGDDAAVWRSDDGGAWHRSPDDGVFGGEGTQVLHAVVAFEEGFLAVGSDQAGAAGDQDAAVWASEDGRGWRRLDPAAFAAPGPQSMEAVALGADRVVAVGADGDQAAAWTSLDLVGWRTDRLGGGRIDDVDSADGSVVAVGSAPGDDGVLDAATWRLAGEVWERADGGALTAPGNQRLHGVVLGPELAIAVGATDFGGGDDAASWASSDAVTWTATPHDENVLGGDGAQRMTDVAAGGGTAVAVGWSGSTPEARDAVVWVADQIGEQGPAGRL